MGEERSTSIDLFFLTHFEFIPESRLRWKKFPWQGGERRGSGGSARPVPVSTGNSPGSRARPGAQPRAPRHRSASPPAPTAPEPRAPVRPGQGGEGGRARAGTGAL